MPSSASGPLRKAERLAAAALLEGDGVVLAQLTARIGEGAPCAVEAFLYFPERASACEVARLLGEDGYATSVNDAPIDDRWGVVARRILAAHPLAIVALRRQMEALATEHRGDYDGWGASGADGDAAALLEDAHARLRRFAPHAPFGWPLERHERFARSIAKRPAATLAEVVAEQTDEWRVDLAKAWNWWAVLRDGDEEIDVGAYVQLALVPKAAVACDRANLSYWLREHEFLAKDAQPVFPMPPQLRRPFYHFVLNLKEADGTEQGRFFGFERKDGVRDGRTWDIERFAQAAFALGAWQGAMSRDAAALAHPSLLRDALQKVSRHDTPGDASARANALLGELRRRPQTVCHNLISAVNLAADPADEAITVLRDWRFVGTGPLGSDLAGLICQAPQSESIPLREFPALETRALERYVDGLRAANWTGDAAEIAWVYGAVAALLFEHRAVGAHDTALHRAIAAHARALGDAAFAALR